MRALIIFAATAYPLSPFSVVAEPVAVPALAFELVPGPGYARDEIVQFDSRMALFRRPAGVPDDPRDDAILVISRDPLGACVPEALRSEVALDLFEGLGAAPDRLVRLETGPVAIDGMDGFRFAGMLSRRGSGLAFVWETYLFDECETWKLGGAAPVSDLKADKAAFDAMAQSFRRR